MSAALYPGRCCSCWRSSPWLMRSTWPDGDSPHDCNEHHSDRSHSWTGGTVPSPNGLMGRLQLSLPPVAAFFCCGVSCGPWSCNRTVPRCGASVPQGKPCLACRLSVLFIKGEHGLPRVARRQLSHHFGVLQVCPHIKILAALVKHLPNNSAIGSNPHGWGHLVQFWLGLSFSVTLPPNVIFLSKQGWRHEVSDLVAPTCSALLCLCPLRRNGERPQESCQVRARHVPMTSQYKGTERAFSVFNLVCFCHVTDDAMWLFFNFMPTRSWQSTLKRAALIFQCFDSTTWKLVGKLRKWEIHLNTRFWFQSLAYQFAALRTESLPPSLAFLSSLDPLSAHHASTRTPHPHPPRHCW